MDEYLNDTYKIIPSLQKTIISQKDKIKSFDDYISKFSEKMNKLNKTILSNKNGRKSASGITLIALIITIIVLLILARSNYCSFNWK